MRTGVFTKEGETGLILNVGQGSIGNFTLTLYFAAISRGLPWFFQNARRGHDVAPMGITTIRAREELCL